MPRGKDGLYRRKNRILHFRYEDLDGGWQEKSTGERDRKKAKDIRKEFLRQLKAGELPTEKAKQTVEVACTQWVQQHEHNGPKGGLRSAKGRKNEQSYLRQLVKRLGCRRLNSLTLDDLKNYRSNRGVKARSINIELGILVNVLKEANLWHGPLKNYKRSPEPKSGLGKALTPEQRRVLESTAGSRDAWQVAYWAQMLAINTGLRGGEVKKLQFQHVDLEKRRLDIKEAKTEAGNRFVPLNNVALWAVSKLRNRAELLGAKEPDHYLLPADLSAHTKKMDPLCGKKGFDVTRHQESWSTAWRNLRQGAAAAVEKRAAEEKRDLTLAEREDIKILRGLGFHSLRHTFITMMAERNVPLPVTMAMVGHMSAEVTTHYTHISEKAQRQAVELLDAPVTAERQSEQKERVYRA